MRTELRIARYFENEAINYKKALEKQLFPTSCLLFPPKHLTSNGECGLGEKRVREPHDIITYFGKLPCESRAINRRPGLPSRESTIRVSNFRPRWQVIPIPTVLFTRGSKEASKVCLETFTSEPLDVSWRRLWRY